MADSWVPTEYMELSIEAIAQADEVAVCSQQPSTYFNACWPAMWVSAHGYSVGDIVRPPTQNGFVYECTGAGTSGSSEPPWGSVQDATFADGGATWKTHVSYSLINTEIVPGDKSIGDHPLGGRALTIAEKPNVLIHTGGIVTHTALMTALTRVVHYAVKSSTVYEGDDLVEAGKLSIINPIVVRGVIV